MLITSYRKPQVRNTIQIEPDHQGIRNKEVTTPELESCLEDYAGPKLRRLHQTRSDRHRRMSEPAGAGPRITYGAAIHFLQGMLYPP